MITSVVTESILTIHCKSKPQPAMHCWFVGIKMLVFWICVVIACAVACWWWCFCYYIPSDSHWPLTNAFAAVLCTVFFRFIDFHHTLHLPLLQIISKLTEKGEKRHQQQQQQKVNKQKNDCELAFR